MYTLLIVEDEPLEREMLEDFIESEYPKITEIYAVNNGIDALRVAQKKQPDIVLVDINIPGMSGLELIEELSKNKFPGQILITTAYNSFQYATKALKYGAVGYVLKPVMDEELKEYLEKCFSMVDERRQRDQLQQQMSEGIVSICSYAQRYLIQDFFHGKIQERAMTAAYRWPSNGKLQARMVRIHFERPLTIEEKNELVLLCEDLYQPLYRTLLSVEETEVFLMIQPDEVKCPEFLQVSVWAFAMDAARVIWKKRQDFWMAQTEICASYQQLRDEVSKLLEKKEEAGKACCQETVCFEPVFSGEIYQSKEQKMRLQKASQRMREGSMERAVRVFHSCLEKENMIWQGVFLILKAVLLYDEEMEISDGVLAVDEKNPCDTLAAWLSEVISKPKLDENTGMKPVIQEAFHIMEQEYDCADLSQTVIAERLGLSPTYFSRLFKKETGEKFVPAMTKIRMKHGKEFLREGIAPEKVASMCGYNNRKYFYEMFKMYFGISPVQYQQQAAEKTR